VGNFADRPFTFAKEMIATIFNPKDWKGALEMINKSGILTQRYRSMMYNIDANLAWDTLIGSGKLNRARLTKKFLFESMNLSAKGDKLSVIVGGYSLYKAQISFYTSDKGGSLTKAEAEKKALRDVEMAVNETLQSGEIMYTPRALRQPNLLKLFTMFQSQQAALYNLQLSMARGLVNAIANGAKKPALKSLQWLVIAITNVFIYGLVNGGFRYPEDEEKYNEYILEMIMENFTNLTVIDKTIGAFAKAWVKDEKVKIYDVVQTPVLTAYQNLWLKSFAVAKKAEKGEAGLSDYFEVVKVMNMIFGGVPIDPVARQVSGVSEFMDDQTGENFLKSLGYTDYALKKTK
jgi:hypothetical protein